MEEIYPEYKEKSYFERFLSTSPMVPIGVAGLTLVVVHGIYTFRNRKTRPSLFLINYRLAAQGTFVGCLGVALTYKILNEHILKRNEPSTSKPESES